MLVTLRKARQIDNLLQKITRSEINTNGTISVYSKIDTVALMVNEANVKTENSVNDVIEASKNRFLIRRLIDESNNSCGLNELISKRAEFEHVKSVLLNIEISETTEDVEILQKMVESKCNNNTQPMYGTSSDSIVYSTVSVDLKEKIQNNIDLCKRGIIEYDDMILAKNVTVKIELDVDVVSFLEKLKIV